MKRETHESYQTRILRVLVHIQAHLDDALPLADLAAVACFSPYHFHRVFGAMVGESVKQHIRRLRLERAAMRLRFTASSVTSIAFGAGYETHEAFTRAFRQMFDASPTDFRKRERTPAFPESANRIHYQQDGLPTSFHPSPQGDLAMNVRIASIDPIRVAFLRHLGPYENAWPTWARMLGWAEKAGLSDSRRFGISHDDPQITPPGKLRHDACIEVPACFEPDGDIGVQEIAGGDYAVLTHEGAYENLSASYAFLYGQWLPQSGREPRTAPCFEHLQRTPMEAAPDELLTDIYLPLAHS